MKQAAITDNARAEWREGWGIVLTAAIGVGIGGIFYPFVGAIMHGLQEAYGWSRGDIAFGVTLITITHLFTNAPMGILVDKFGSRRVALWGIWAFALSFSSLGLAGPGIGSWYIACVLFGIAGHGVSPIVWTGGVVRSFAVYRGMALALTLTGGAVMVAITPTLVVWLVDLLGVSWTFSAVGMMGALLMFVSTLWLYKEKFRPLKTSAVVSQNETSQTPGYTVREAVGTINFWKMVVAFTLIAACAGTFMIHIQPMLLDSGLTPATAATVAFFMGPAMMVGRLGTGILFDYFDPRVITGLAFTLPVFAALMLLSLDGNYLMSAMTGAVVGLCLGAEIDVIAYLTSRYFGIGSYGKLFSIMLVFYSIGMGTGSGMAGYMYDFMGSYDLYLMLLCGGATTAVALAVSMSKPVESLRAIQ